MNDAIFISHLPKENLSKESIKTKIFNNKRNTFAVHSYYSMKMDGWFIGI